MGKADIYVFLIVLGVAAVAAAGWGVVVLAQRVARARRVANRDNVDGRTHWVEYLRVGKDGGYLIGVERSAWIGHDRVVFEGPIQLFDLKPDHDPVEVRLKVGEAQDRAFLCNMTRKVTTRHVEVASDYPQT